MGRYGAAGRIRTCDHLVRSQILYPAELQPHWITLCKMQTNHIQILKNTKLTSKYLKDGAAGRSRTCDRLVRSQVLYPAELQPHQLTL
jgi:hypothetical protein